MKNKVLLLCGLTAVLLWVAPALAKTEWVFDQEIELDVKPIDTTVSADGNSLYILTKKAILVYSLQANRITDTIPLDKKFSGISTAPRLNGLLLTSSSDKIISIIKLSETTDLPLDSSPVIGPPDARVTLTVFMDFQCPYCSREFPVIEQLLEKYPQDLRLVIKHFPLNSHKFASTAAVAALAAERQGKYLELTREMLKNFRTLNEEALIKLAGDLGLDLEKLKQDRTDSAFQQQIQRDRQLARTAGVRGVPSLYINGSPVQNRSLEGMAAMIDAELKKEK
jgi:protein-disulfide isomerase